MSITGCEKVGRGKKVVERKKRHSKEQGKDFPRLYSSKETSGLLTIYWFTCWLRPKLIYKNLLFKSHNMCEPKLIHKCYLWMSPYARSFMQEVLLFFHTHKKKTLKNVCGTEKQWRDYEPNADHYLQHNWRALWKQLWKLSSINRI